MTTLPKTTLLAISFVLISAFCFGGSALADENAKLERLKELNMEAIQAMKAEDYDKAVELLQESLSLEELNVTYLNLGRAYAKAGKCVEALDAYDRMAVAPRVEVPPPEKVYEILVSYRAELLEQCPGTLVIECSSSSMMVRIDGGEPAECTSDPISLPPGEHKIEALIDNKVVATKKTTVEGLSTGYVELNELQSALDDPEMERLKMDLLSVGHENRVWLEPTGWVAAGLGAGFLVAAIVHDSVVVDETAKEFDRAVAEFDPERARSINRTYQAQSDLNGGLVGTGIAFAAIGTSILLVNYLVLTGPPTNEESDASPTASLGIGLGSASVQLTW